mmetsp:Transcript_43811/g.103583  ORF Transcript_43811/g.103583 Transcript_43811/m.103583 type:complete len:222 (+) Transcript_43811:1114-1779(+)
MELACLDTHSLSGPASPTQAVHAAQATPQWQVLSMLLASLMERLPPTFPPDCVVSGRRFSASAARAQSSPCHHKGPQRCGDGIRLQCPSPALALAFAAHQHQEYIHNTELARARGPRSLPSHPWDAAVHHSVSACPGGVHLRKSLTTCAIAVQPRWYQQLPQLLCKWRCHLLQMVLVWGHPRPVCGWKVLGLAEEQPTAAHAASIRALRPYRWTWKPGLRF